MAFGKPKQAVQQLTPAQEVERWMGMAASELERANKAGRLDAQTVHATRSVAASNLALLSLTMQAEVRRFQELTQSGSS